MNWTWLTHNPYAIAMAVVGVLTVIAGGAHGAILLLAKYAATTPGDEDDKRYAKWLAWTDALMAFLDVVRRMPRLTVGPLPSTQPIASVTNTGATLPPMKPLSSAPPAATVAPTTEDKEPK